MSEEQMKKQEEKVMRPVSYLMDPNDCKNGFVPIGDYIELEDGMPTEVVDALKEEFAEHLLHFCKEKIHCSVEEVNGKKVLKGYLYVEG